MTELIFHWAEASFIAEKTRKAYNSADMAKNLDPFFGSVDKYLAAYAIHIAMEKKTSTGEINYYDVLGVDTTANMDQISQCFRRLSPLVNSDDNCSAAAEEAHRHVRIAWHTLSCPSKRREYDIRNGFQAKEEIRRPRCVSNIGGGSACRRTIYC